MFVDWCGRQWEVSELPPSAALVVSRLASDVPGESLQACTEIASTAGISLDELLPVVFHYDGGEPDLLDLMAGILREGTARPWKTTVALSRATVQQWSMIRGRLIEKGISDPLRQLPSLTALLDVVEVMILDSAKDDEEREKIIRDLYRRDNPMAPPPGWEEGFEGFEGIDL
ncbi:hypothetical protein [uncultured Corynebacterium sp.]|uniref:DUF7240 domain-containing protein n=1 Tax=uncultured Corynebacterium sp. TaxID=159447 RepID=UPI00260C54F3|nr:hypothetical protein [uncultured Corynebacterium sp.]